MKYLIVGLGNIGDEYAGTRHNIGFLIVDTLAKQCNAVFQDKRYENSHFNFTNLYMWRMPYHIAWCVYEGALCMISQWKGEYALLQPFGHHESRAKALAAAVEPGKAILFRRFLLISVWPMTNVSFGSLRIAQQLSSLVISRAT